MVEYLKKKMKTKDGSVRFYYVKVTTKGTQRISKEVYDKNNYENVHSGGVGPYNWRVSDSITPAQRQNPQYTVSNAKNNEGYYIAIEDGLYNVKIKGVTIQSFTKTSEAEAKIGALIRKH